MSRNLKLPFAIASYALGNLALAGCAGPDLTQAQFQCASQADCLDGYVCASRAGACVEPTTDAPGLSATEIKVGYTGALTGGPTEIGRSMRNGIEAYFAAVNAQGGVDGRSLTLVARDDGGERDRAVQNARDLISTGEAFALVGPGNPRAAVAVADVAVESETLLIGPRSGAPSLHSPPPRYVFNTRASFADEITQAVAYMVGSRDVLAAPSNIAVFAEGTSTEGELSEQAETLYALATAALDDGSVDAPTPRLLQHRLDIIDVDGPVGAGLKWLAENARQPNANGEKVGAILLASTGAPSQAFVTGFLDVFHRIQRGDAPDSIYQLTPEEIASIQTFSQVYFWAPSALNIDDAANALRLSGTYTTLGGEVPYCRQVFTTAVTPPTNLTSTGFVNFRQRMTEFDPAAPQDRVAYEGYVAAQIFVEALLTQGPKTNTEGLVDTLEGFSALELDTGTYSFGPTDHTAEDTVFPARLTDDCEFEEFDIDNLVPPDSGDGCVGDTCELRGIIVEDTELTADKLWVLNGTVFVGDGVNAVTLSVEPGTTIIGGNGNPSDDEDLIIDTAPGVLVIRPNSRLVADGTADDPIVFTSEKPVGERSTGDWGGIVLNGNAPTNACVTGNCPPLGEGGSGYYGGNDPTDSSGVLRYVRIEYAGLLVNDENELNGIALQGVGNGTVIDYLQVHRGQDDGIEFFGGTVDVKHLLVTCADDDSIDWTQGWTGRGQHLIVRQCANHGDNAIEADNNGTEVDTDGDGEADTAPYRNATPRSHPILSNVTLIGVPDDDKSDYGMLLREGTAAEIANSVVMGFNDACINIDHDETFSNAVTTSLPPFELTENLMLRNSFIDCATAFEDSEDDPFLISEWATTFTRAGGAPTDNTIGSADVRDAFDLSSPNFRLNGGSPAQSGAVQPAGEFFDDVTYIGAVSADVDWTAGWTTFEGDACDAESPPARCDE